MSAIFRILFLTIVAVLVLIAIVIGVQNGVQLVDLNLLLWSWSQIPLIAVMIICIAFGMFLAIVIALPNEIKLFFRVRAQQKEAKNLKLELDNMRNLPLTGIDEAMREGFEKHVPEEEAAE
jgi:uncharacterized membrane protein YciS (DUF1049 family)